jgi:hypothetical protein
MTRKRHLRMSFALGDDGALEIHTKGVDPANAWGLVRKNQRTVVKRLPREHAARVQYLVLHDDEGCPLSTPEIGYASRDRLAHLHEICTCHEVDVVTRIPDPPEDWIPPPWILKK